MTRCTKLLDRSGFIFFAAFIYFLLVIFSLPVLALTPPHKGQAKNDTARLIRGAHPVQVEQNSLAHIGFFAVGHEDGRPELILADPWPGAGSQTLSAYFSHFKKRLPQSPAAHKLLVALLNKTGKGPGGASGKKLGYERLALIHALGQSRALLDITARWPDPSDPSLLQYRAEALIAQGKTRQACNLAQHFTDPADMTPYLTALRAVCFLAAGEPASAELTLDLAPKAKRDAWLENSLRAAATGVDLGRTRSRLSSALDAYLVILAGIPLSDSDLKNAHPFANSFLSMSDEIPPRLRARAAWDLAWRAAVDPDLAIESFLPLLPADAPRGLDAIERARISNKDKIMQSAWYASAMQSDLPPVIVAQALSESFTSAKTQKDRARIAYLFGDHADLLRPTTELAPFALSLSIIASMNGRAGSAAKWLRLARLEITEEERLRFLRHETAVQIAGTGDLNRQLNRFAEAGFPAGGELKTNLVQTGMLEILLLNALGAQLPDVYQAELVQNFSANKENQVLPVNIFWQLMQNGQAEAASYGLFSAILAWDDLYLASDRQSNQQNSYHEQFLILQILEQQKQQDAARLFALEFWTERHYGWGK